MQMAQVPDVPAYSLNSYPCEETRFLVVSNLHPPFQKSDHGALHGPRTIARSTYGDTRLQPSYIKLVVSKDFLVICTQIVDSCGCLVDSVFLAFIGQVM